VFGKQFASKDSGDFLIAIQCYVDRKGDAGRARDLRISSWTGLPSITPHVGLGCRAFGVVQHEHGFQPASPGATILRQP